MKFIYIFVVVLLVAVVWPLAAQDLPPTLPPNYRLIKKLTKKKDSPYFYDSLAARFDRCDTTLTIDDVRCLYFGGKEVSITDCHRRYKLLISRFGRHQGRANDVWWQYQMLQSAVWSTGDGSEEHPLHVQSYDDFLEFYMLDNPGSTLVRTKRRGHFSYVAHPLPDGTWRWFCFRKK